jgi:V8-like Glu-specific endopeptidase
VKGWTEHGDGDYDYALITLADTGMLTPWMSFGYNDGLGDWIMNSNGYPGDKPSFSMWHTDDRITDTSDNHFDVNLDVVPGDSGSGVYAYWKDQNKRVIYGIVTYQWTETVPNFPDFWNTHTNKGNRATRINEVRFNLICGWINAGIC